MCGFMSHIESQIKFKLSNFLEKTHFTGDGFKKVTEEKKLIIDFEKLKEADPFIADFILKDYEEFYRIFQEILQDSLIVKDFGMPELSFINAPVEIKITKTPIFIRAIEAFEDYLDMARKFIQTQPLMFDKNRLWWVWDFNENKWAMVDETEILVNVSKALKESYLTTNIQHRAQIVEALRQTGRQNIPKNIPETWVQLKNKIINIETGLSRQPTPEYFCVNPIPWDMSEKTETPIIDGLFEDWVGKNCVVNLKEILAFCMLPNYYIHRIFALIGSGSNGKTCFLTLLKRFLGIGNVTSTSIERLANGRFESAKIYKKLAVTMGETDIKLLSKTDI